MPINRGRVRLNTSGIKQIRSQLDTTIDIALTQTAIIIRDDAKALAPKDTEAMAESIYISSIEDSNYEEATASAQSKFDSAKREGKTPKGVRLSDKSTLKLFPEQRPDEQGVVYIVCAAQHGIINEYGSARRGPQPFMLPAVQKNIGTLTSQIRTAMSGMSVKGVLTTYSKL